MNSKALLKEIFGVSFTEQPNLTAIRQFHQKNAFCCNGKEEIIGICACENDFTALSIPANQLQSLQYLNLSENKSLTALAFDGGLSNLKHLDVNDCIIKKLKLPVGFSNLEWLDASRNKLTAFIPEGKFEALIHLDLGGNELNNFQANLISKFPKLERLYLKENPLPSSKLASVEKQANCLEFMCLFNRGLEKGVAVNKEYKVILVGNGGVGKSCLVERLVYDSFEGEYLSTHGIALEQYKDETEEPPYPYILNLWDFGGQDIYHATHRLFMRTNGLFLVLWDNENLRKPFNSHVENGVSVDYENHPLAYWLHYVKHQSAKSPVLIVKTKALEDKSEHPERANLIDNYLSSLPHYEWLNIDSEEDNWAKNGFKRLLSYIQESIETCQGKEELPQHWQALRQHLRDLYQKGEKAIALEEYLRIAKEDFGLEEPLDRLQEWLVPSGVVFYKAGYFGDTVILDQGWAIQAIYTIFNRHEGHYRALEKQQGNFTGKDLQRIWQAKNYRQAEQELFVRFMLSCEICFEVEVPKEEKHISISFEDRQFIAPQIMDLDASRNVNRFKRNLKNENAHYVRFNHSFLHYGIIQSFIIRTHTLAKNAEDIWRAGILVYETDEIEALVEANTQKRYIYISATEKAQPLLNKIRNLLYELQKDQVEEFVSLDGENYVALEKLRTCQYEDIDLENGLRTPVKPLLHYLQHDTNAKFAVDQQETNNEGLIEQLRDKSTTIMKPSVYFSYAWKDEDNPDRELLVNRMYNELQPHFDLKRDKNDATYGEYIDEFMLELAKGELIIVFLSKKYLRSLYCMYELFKIAEKNSWDKFEFKDRILPIVVEPLDFSRKGILELLDYWIEIKDSNENYKKELHKRGVGFEFVREVDELIDLGSKAHRLINWIKNLNRGSIKLYGDDFKVIKQTIKDRFEKSTINENVLSEPFFNAIAKLSSEISDTKTLLLQRFSKDFGQLSTKMEVILNGIDDLKGFEKDEQAILQQLTKQVQLNTSNTQFEQLHKKLEDQFQSIQSQLPRHIITLWQEANSKAAMDADVKGKLKLKFNLLPFLAYEKEISLDVKKVFKDIIQDIKNGHYFTKPA